MADTIARINILQCQVLLHSYLNELRNEMRSHRYAPTHLENPNHVLCFLDGILIMLNGDFLSLY